MLLLAGGALTAVAHARQHGSPTTLSPGHRNASNSPWGDRSNPGKDPGRQSRHATIAAILARRAKQPRVPSVAELTERQSASAATTASVATTELARSAYTPIVEYIPLQQPASKPGANFDSALRELIVAARSNEGARDLRGFIRPSVQNGEGWKAAKKAASGGCVREWQTQIRKWFSPPRGATEGDCKYACTHDRSTWCVGYEFAADGGGTCKLYDDCTKEGRRIEAPRSRAQLDPAAIPVDTPLWPAIGENRDPPPKSGGRLQPKDTSSKPTTAYPNGRDYSSGSRCGESWDDAAVKCGMECGTGCNGIQDMCYLDLPTCDHKNPAGKCWAYSGGVSDSWCATASAMIDGSDRTKDKEDSFYNLCMCEEIVVGPEARTNKYVAPMNASTLPPRDADLVALVVEEGELHPGLPECTWKPPPGCTNVTQYECVEGAAARKCSGENWFNQPEQCGASCVHTALLRPPPYYAVWRSGPRARPWQSNSQLPHYAAKDAVRDPKTQWAFDHPKRILMSVWCKSSQIEFVGVSLFSPAYEQKARRLLGSCNMKGLCCKATMVGSNFMGPETPEGTDAFRYRMIALKPLFLLDQMEKTLEPVVFLDVDLEFHQFPELFLDNSWPEGPRDVALFNFWANETNLTNRHTPNIGSAVAYFNKTFRAKKLLNAWAEAMQYGTNQHAPDDQVLDKLLNEGGWLERVSLGWLPSSYLRLMPSYYRGVQAVIDHDHGSAPGIDGHSRVKPKLPPTFWTEPVNEEAYMDAAAAAVAAANAADPNSVGADDPNAPPVPVQAPAPVVAPVPEMAPLGQAPAPVAVPAPVPVVPATGPTVARSAENPNGCMIAAQGECGPMQAIPLPAGGVCTGESKCCSAGGYCGSGPLYCGEGMQAEYSHSHKLCGGADAGKKDEGTVASRAGAGPKPAAPLARTSASAPAPQAAAAPAPEIPKFDPLPATPAVQDPYDPALSNTDGLYRPPVPGAAPAPVGQGTGRSAEFNPVANDGLHHPSENLLLV